MNEKGIEHQFTMPGTPQQNGEAEQFNCTIMDKAMSMLHQAGLSNGFWEHAVSTAVHIYNFTPIHLLEKWNPGKVPDVLYFHVFGCKAYIVTGWLAGGQENCQGGRMSAFDPQDW